MASLSKYKTPGVYLEELVKFPPSIAAVDTAIPAFIGYTERTAKGSENFLNTPKRIRSPKEFRDFFGEPREERFSVSVDVNTNDNSAEISVVGRPEIQFYLPYSVDMFFRNGGGPCYIVTVGSFEDNESIDVADLSLGLEAIRKVDEVTLIVMPDAANLPVSDYTGLMNAALVQCEDLMDRFTIMDVPGNAPLGTFEERFRTNLTNEIGQLKYGAAYYPFLETAVRPALSLENSFIDVYRENGVLVTGGMQAYLDAREETQRILEIVDNFSRQVQGFVEGDRGDLVSLIEGFMDELGNPTDIRDAIADTQLDVDDLQQAVIESIATGDVNARVSQAESAEQTARVSAENAVAATPNDLSFSVIDDNFRTGYNGIYNAILSHLDQELRVQLPPSGAVAGIYARVDRTDGVWKAPANVNISGVVKPSIAVNEQDQGNLNVDATSGKSINAIRTFTGRGPAIVWGARTLAGNDNEWRYISVRRFFNMVEESTKKATERFVFEPNDKNTWIKVRAMIENFLTIQWNAGALQGSTPEQAFYVAVGLNETMSAQDILEGRMIVEIGMAVVRPAEFIILRFSHKLPEA